MSDKHSKNNNNNDNTFFDVSFDEPFEGNQSNRNMNSQSESSKHSEDAYKEKGNSEDSSAREQASSDFVSRRESFIQSESNDRKIEPLKSSLMLNRSIKRVQKLFTETDQAQSSHSDIRSAKSRNLSERARRASIQTNKLPVKKNLSKRAIESKQIEDNITVENDNNELENVEKLYSDKVGYDTSSMNLSDKELNLTKQKNPTINNTSAESEYYNRDLPSPDQLSIERERRRKQRIEQLEMMNSNKEIEDSYQSISSRWNKKDTSEASPAPSIRPNQERVQQEYDDQASSDRDAVSYTNTHTPKHNSDKSDVIINSGSINGEVEGEKDSSNNTSHLHNNHEANQHLNDESLSPDDHDSNESHWSSEMDSIHVFTPTNEDDGNDLNHEGPMMLPPNGNQHMGSRSLAYNDDLDESQTSKSRRQEKRKNKRNTKKDKYSLKDFSLKDKTFFGINVTFNVIKRLIIYLLIVIVLVGALIGGTGIGFFANLVANTPPPTEQEMEEQINHLDQQSTLYYGNGEPIANVRTDLVRSIANLSEISNYIIDGFIATEDEYFAEHPGIVPKALIRAVLQTFTSGSGTGGSTLTQQLVKQQMLTNDVTFFRKANEILLALRLENYFSKEEILTAYLNVSPFGRNNNGDNVAGIAEASEGIFGVSPNEVTLNQAAFLAGLPQDPYTYTPYDQNGEIRDEETLQYGLERMNEVLYRMYREEKITKEDYDEAIAYDITQDFLAPEPREEERQSYLYQAVMNGAIEQLMLLNIQDDGYTWQQVFNDDAWYNEYFFAAEEQLRTGGYRVYSTIDREIYDQLQESAQAYNDQLGAVYDGVYTDPETGAETYYVEEVQTGMVAIDNNTGAVLGFVAGTDFENNQIDHAFQMRRSPGSTIKPLAVYGPAVENNIVNPATVIPDTAFEETYEDGSSWAPTNYGNVVSNTLMTARTALLRSDNIPAVRIYDELLRQGVPIIDYLERMGFNTVDSYTEEDTEYLAFSLGGVTTGPTVFEETRAFSTFATGGEYVDGYYIERIEDAFGNTVFQQNETPTRVFSEDTNYIMVDMLRDTMTEGTGRTANEYMNVPGDWIAKSGISENSKDIWFIASTPSITIGSWIGYDSRYADYTIDVSDGFDRESVRSQIYWARIVNDLYELRPEIFGTDETFVQPDSVQEQTVLEQTGTLPGTVTNNGNTYQLTGPTKTELFKVSNPAPELTFDFMVGASEEDLAMFWNNVRSQQEEIRRQQQQQQQSSSAESDDSDNSGEDESSEEDETSENPEESTETPGEEQQPPESQEP